MEKGFWNVIFTVTDDKISDVHIKHSSGLHEKSKRVVFSRMSLLKKVLEIILNKFLKEV